ncbi:MAG: hypothetical protein FWF17_01640 [Betaproteobacteria bacterium]|nr:hypothetical protein [Betaproteobacteria bacterium]
MELIAIGFFLWALWSGDWTWMIFTGIALEIGSGSKNLTSLLFIDLVHRNKKR